MEIPICINCKNTIDNCGCVCPYCGEVELCVCCIGLDAVTGG